MKKSISRLLPLTLLILLIQVMPACKKDASFPITPEIAFKSLEKLTNVSNRDSLVLTFSFTDGDGDIGSPSENTTSQDVFAKLFEKRNGVFQEAVLSAPLEYRLPYMEPSGNNHSLKGNVVINIDYNILVLNDTIKYELYIQDRAGHKSNTISTSEIITRVQ